MKNYMKIIIGILIGIFIIFAIFLFKYLVDPTYDKTILMSKNDVQSILNKRYEISNVYAKFEREMKVGDVGNYTLYTEFFVKDNMAKVVSTTENGNRKIFQENTETKEILWIHETNKAVMQLNDERFGAFCYIWEYDILDLDEYDNFVYLGETDIDGRRNVVIRIIEDDSDIYRKDIIYIDKETGLITKHIIKVPFFHLTDTTEIKTGVISDEDVKFIEYESVYPDYRKSTVK